MTILQTPGLTSHLWIVVAAVSEANRWRNKGIPNPIQFTQLNSLWWTGQILPCRVWDGSQDSFLHVCLCVQESRQTRAGWSMALLIRNLALGFSKSLPWSRLLEHAGRAVTCEMWNPRGRAGVSTQKAPVWGQTWLLIHPGANSL